jgi:hypothetical protein
VITNENGKWMLHSKDGRKLLGTFGSQEEAQKHEAMILAMEKMKGDSVLRIDGGELEKPTKLKNGFLKVDARLTRTGVFEYLNDDGTIRRELRLPEEVFKADALDSFSMMPVTDEHPPVFLSSDNARAYSRGSAGEKITRDGKFVRASLMITDASLVAKLEDGQAREVSCGYLCDLDHKPGMWNGEKYDAVQRNIRGNHIAIVPRGRAGAEARVRMDAAVSGVIRSEKDGKEPSPSKESSVKVTIDGVEFDSEKDSQAFSQALARQQQKNADTISAINAKLDALTKDAESSRAKLDAKEEELKKLKADADKAPEKVRAELKARAALESKAAKILGGKFKFDGLSDKDVISKALEKAKPDLKLDGKTDAYLEARFDLAVEAAENADETFDEDRRRAQGEHSDEDEGEEDERSDDDEEEHEDDGDDQAAFERMRKDGASQWKRTLKQHGVTQ